LPRGLRLAYLNDDEPTELASLLGVRGARVRRGGSAASRRRSSVQPPPSISGATRNPGGILGRQRTAASDQRSELLEKACAIGPQLLGDKLAPRLSFRRRRARFLARSRTHSPPRLWKLWKTRLQNRRRSALRRSSSERATTLSRSSSCGITRTGDASKNVRKEREFLRPLPNVGHHLAVCGASPCV
jgi:hypothetical protein